MEEKWQDRPPAKITIEFMSEIKATMMLLENKINNLTESLNELKTTNNIAHNELVTKIEKMNTDNKCDFVNQKDFNPVRTIVYGMAGTILTLFLLGVASLVIIKLK